MEHVTDREDHKMNDFEKAREEFMNDSNAKKINKLASAADKERLGQLFDKEELTNAFKKGDSNTLKNIVSNVLKTEEGQRLAKNISEIMGKNK